MEELTLAVHLAKFPLAKVRVPKLLLRHDALGVESAGWLILGWPLEVSITVEFTLVELAAVFRTVGEYLVPVTVLDIEDPLAGVLGIGVSVNLDSVTVSNLNKLSSELLANLVNVFND